MGRSMGTHMRCMGFYRTQHFWNCMFCVHGTTTSAERICNCTFCVHETLTFVENKRFVYTKPLLFRVFKMHGVHKGFEG